MHLSSTIFTKDKKGIAQELAPRRISSTKTMLPVTLFSRDFVQCSPNHLPTLIF